MVTYTHEDDSGTCLRWHGGARGRSKAYVRWVFGKVGNRKWATRSNSMGFNSPYFRRFESCTAFRMQSGGSVLSFGTQFALKCTKKNHSLALSRSPKGFKVYRMSLAAARIPLHAPCCQSTSSAIRRLSLKRSAAYTVCGLWKVKFHCEKWSFNELNI